jgi:hypothetical protein
MRCVTLPAAAKAHEDPNGIARNIGIVHDGVTKHAEMKQRLH